MDWREISFRVCISGRCGAVSGAMKCPVHQAEAIGVCVYCGRAMCAECGKVPGPERFVCSEKCATTLGRNEQAVETLLLKNAQNARASAFYSYLCGGLSAGGAVGAGYYMPVPFLVWFTAACSAVFIISGIRYSMIARKRNFP
jgi:hypothetical protein